MSHQIERAVLASILFDPDTIIAARDRGIGPEMFANSDHAEIYRAMHACAERRDPPDIMNVSIELERHGHETLGFLFLSELLAEPVQPIGRASYLDSLVAHHRTRTVSTRLLDAVAELKQNPDADAEALVASVLAGLPKHGAGAGPVPFMTLAEQYGQRLDAQREGTWSERVIPTGFPTLDKVLGGGFRPGELVVVAGRPGMAKSSIALALARNAARAMQQAAVLYSLEMTGSSIFERAIADASGLTMDQLRAKRLGDDHYLLLKRIAAQMAESGVWVDDTAGVTTEQAHIRARRLQAEHGLALVVSDYLQIMGDSRQKQDNEVNRVSRMSRGHKLMAMDLSAPVVMLSQLNRAVERESPFIPHLHHLRDSDSIEQDADIVLLLYRHDYYSQQGLLDPDPVKAGTCDVYIAKQRNGGTGVVTLNFDATTMSFSDPAVAPPAWIGAAD